MPGLRDQKVAQRQAMEARLGREQTIWLATTRSDGRPHLVPVWFAWYDERIYICTVADSQKMVNLERNRRAAVALPDTTDVLIVEGLVNLDLITSERVQFIALPLKVKGGDGSPVRALAIIDD